MKDEKLGVAVVEGALNPEVKDLVIDLAEFEVDSFIDEGVLKEIPGIKLAIACKKTWGAINDQLFLRKVAAFLHSSPKFTKEEVDEFVVDHWRGDEAKRLGETVVLLLDRLDDMDKPKMLAKVFAAFVRKHITYDAFRRLAVGIDQSSIQDLKALGGEKFIPEHMAEPYPWGLVRSGFARQHLKDMTYGVQARFEAKVSDLGLLFMKCILNDF